MSSNYKFDRIVALSPITNAILRNCIDLAQAQNDLKDIEVLQNIGTASLMHSLERMDVQIFVDDPLLFINDLYKIDLLSGNLNENRFRKGMKWIAERLFSEQVTKTDTLPLTWVFDYPERHLSTYVGVELPLERQQRSQEITETIHFLLANQEVPQELLDQVIAVLLKYGLDDGWRQIPSNLLGDTESYFAILHQHFPQHEELKKKAIEVNNQNIHTKNSHSDRTVLINGALEMLNLLSKTSHGNTQMFASHYKNMLNLTLETSTKLLDAAASSQSLSFQFENLWAENSSLKEIIAKKNEEVGIKNLLIQNLIEDIRPPRA